MYNKPHLAFEQQLELLQSRGLRCENEAFALEVLRAVGYYHLAAYVYPLRQMLPDAERRRGSTVQHRSDAIQDGTRFEDVVALWLFDRRLRLKALDALETVEMSLRTRIAHGLGQRDTFGHVTRSALNNRECAKPARPHGRRANVKDAFDEWQSRYDDLRRQARSEDFVKHHEEKYGSQFPVWVAVDFFDFGSLTRLYELMLGTDQNWVARSYGLQGNVLKGWLKPLNYLRNLCAHHGRMWNRVMTYRIPTPRQAPPSLNHLAGAQCDRAYAPLAILAYLTRRVEPSGTWSVEMRELMEGFPPVGGLTTGRDMGFPRKWVDLDLWQPTSPAVAASA